MQSGYGGDIQQFMVDGSCPPSFFSISPPPPNLINSSSSAAVATDIQNQQKLYHPPPLHHMPMPHFPHPPMTQQLFHHPHFQFFHHQAPQDNPNSLAAAPGAPVPLFLAPTMSFKLGDSDSPANYGDGWENRLHSWHRDQEESAATVKEPFWRPLDLDTDCINRNNKRPKSPENNMSTYNYSKIRSKEHVSIDHTIQANTAGVNYKPFSELEAIYKPSNQTGSGSALTGDNIDAPLVPELDGCPRDATPPSSRKASSGRRKRQVERMSAVAAFFDSLVKRVMDHQESLHCKFLEFMEKREHERAGREEAWRKETALAASREAASWAHETALAASREAAIVSFLERISGERLDLPISCNADDDVDRVGSRRWPKAEVQELIRVRSGLERRFQEPGLKGPLWEEVSVAMATAGYRRSAKRCKEKWENINKYFRKTKESGKKRPQQSKTCPYFHLLDQLYSSSNADNAASDDHQNFESGDQHDAANAVGEIVL